eukprot:CAMPEP_0117037312 /NCGR_PEP_ID=MMETSP0472-20121206/26351_1 /TAXON_ID=693140 ORGANISM="Tiarina fusus, Strain LIS" /NCGR_SAMPLE_ID=MMETSP0472 /ASSEMBLY_ACC=CAM_ASM_000603 /LENGTH=370 /DNA_ID=CAMNT_0004747273 /DNA_START=6 /DNA_END=1118 /DNA_ORIENTATION=+
MARSLVLLFALGLLAAAVSGNDFESDEFSESDYFNDLQEDNLPGEFDDEDDDWTMDLELDSNATNASSNATATNASNASAANTSAKPAPVAANASSNASANASANATAPSQPPTHAIQVTNNVTVVKNITTTHNVTTTTYLNKTDGTTTTTSTPTSNPGDPNSNCSVFVARLSLCRTNPKQCATDLGKYLDASHWSSHPACAGQVSDKCMYTNPKNNYRYLTHWGMQGIQKAVDFLNAQQPVSGLKVEQGLCDAGQFFCNEQGPAGSIGHLGPQGDSTMTRVEHFGSWNTDLSELLQYGSFLGDGGPVDTVDQLIVGDGDDAASHRAVLFAPEWHEAGVGHGPHNSYNLMTTILLTVDFTGNGKTLADAH